MTIAFIGLGHMGGHMAANLVRGGHEVVGFDPVDELREAAVAHGVLAAASATAAVEGAETVVTSLPNGHVLLSVYEEVLPAAAEGTLFIDTSTTGAELAWQAAGQVDAAGHRFIDAPVSGGVVGAEAGTLTFMVGGSEADLELARPVLDPMAGRIVHCGASGNGQAAKLCNNLLLAITQVGVAEAFVLGEKLGLTNQAFYDVASTSAAQCWALQTNCPVPGPVPTSPANRDFEGGFATALMHKDLSLAMAEVERSGLDAQVGRLVSALYASLSETEHAGHDFSSIITTLR
ncbi:3-hydroxyisobutyrate dehydrogenase [Janibacter alkaliphilus]|uniref:3-hydroxyisobutyrate dehydrogenase n=1 Tax=Janibacter alkaliphilus TaxID=1069963 RepID=A0A852X413_9MICO|nr:3-hydroxyisobutyrate dehydrogenase [Janibacter alkaliphilus]NYG36080.1 3-hydroxyisobutyrate dehydrogenase [Janibacter alkaliphilus]